jgi:hypothetical protein
LNFTWVWEQRGEGEFNPPQIATFVDGWTKWRGTLATDIPAVSEVFVRELVQNFMDAARDATHASGQKPKLTFTFHKFSGTDAERVSSHLDLESLKNRFSSFDEHKKLEVRLHEGLTLTGKASNELPVLVVSESGTTGMYGQWDRTNKPGVPTKMRDALLSIARGTAGRGLGAFGEGKKAVIGVSVPRCLFAYSRFAANTNEQGVSRRFMGGTYWQDHEFGDATYSGFAMVGAPLREGANRPRPLEDIEADAAVESMDIGGFEVRGQNELGTTYMFVEPKITPAHVAESLARNWWPVIVKGLAEFEVIDETGASIEIKFPDEIKPFVQAFEAKEDRKVEWGSENASPGDLATLVRELKFTDNTPLGTLKLAVDFTPTTGWSRVEPETNYSVVALVREGMLVSYQHFPRSKRHTPPFVRGVFFVDRVSHPVSEEKLRIVETPLHNKWQESNQSLDVLSMKYANEVYKQVGDLVETFREEQMKDEVRREIDLEMFSEGLSVTGGKKVVTPPPPPPLESTPWSMLNVSGRVEDLGAGFRKAISTRTLQLSPQWADEHEVEVVLGWEVLEDGAKWVEASDKLFSEIFSTDESFVPVSGKARTFRGVITSTPKVFVWESNGYKDLWTLRPYMKVNSVRPIDIEEVANV